MGVKLIKVVVLKSFLIENLVFLLIIIIFKKKNLGNENRLNGSYLLPIEEKSYQMFGATIISSKNGDSVLVG